MAPSSLQELFHFLQQGACHHWIQLTSSNSSPQPAFFSAHGTPFLDALSFHGAHISNFLHSLPTISPITTPASQPSTLPFAGLIFSRLTPPSKPTKKIAPAQVVVGSLEVAEAHTAVDKSHADAGSVEQHMYQMQAEQKVLLWTGPITKEELGRATWTFLHTLAAQFPDRPTKQQQQDVKELMAILSRIYPCKECAEHFKEVLKSNPVQVGSGFELAQWMCRVHNIVNRSLGKPIFPCNRIDARWGAMDCDKSMCDLQGRTH